jgi:hypothetical protein
MDHPLAVKLSCKIVTNAMVLEQITPEQCAAVGALALQHRADRIDLYGHGAAFLPEGYISGSVFKKSKNFDTHDLILDFGVSPEGEVTR